MACASPEGSREGEGPASLESLESLRERVARVARDELGVRPRDLAISVISRALPHFSFNRARTWICRGIGLRIGKRSLIMGAVRLSGEKRAGGHLTIGEDTYISGPLTVDLGASVRIGDRVQLGHDVMLLTVDHEVGPASHRCGSLLLGDIVIGDGCWLGSRVVVLPGVTIGAGSVVAAGSIVTRDVMPNSMVAGVPARTLRALDDQAPPPASQRLRAS